MLFYISLVAFVALLAMLTYRYRSFIAPHLPERVKAYFPSLSHYQPLSTFSDQIGAGINSDNFDIEANIREGDSRTGLNEQGTQEILEIMRRERVNFDQARLIRQNRILARNGIDPSGMPLDSKAVTRL
ncbi:hypothetical protein CPB83DRAFT_876964 [Crepidotus variabilis]|uniref:Uncharacterized protein n=1 Tax=Crepidotus variabilis TaxID=179855 RepID=A0A9P6EBN5_9AGAR|nr:hypothetical protein CPB83DRAFT_876964 [Crepidotus variabilis]